MSVFSKNNNEVINLIIDIGSYSLAGALVLISKGSVPEIIYSKRISLPLNQIRSKEKTVLAIEYNLGLLLDMIFEESRKILELKHKKLKIKKIKKTLCIMSAPWCVSKVKSVKLKREKPVIISPRTLSAITLRSEDNETGEYDLIEKKIIQTKLNGYITASPINKRAKEIEISTFEGKILREMADRIISVLGDSLSGNVIFHSFTLAAFAIVREIFNSDNFLLLEITGDITEISIVKNGLIIKAASFPKGKNLFIDRVSEEFQVDSDISLSFLKLYYERRSEKNFHNRIKEVIGQPELEWLNVFKETFSAMKEPIPSKIFLAMDSALASYFADFIKAEMKNMEKETEVVSLNASAFGQFCKYGDNPDPFLALETIFLTHAIPNNEPERKKAVLAGKN